MLVYYNNKFCSQSKRKPPNKRTKNKENFLAVLYVFSTVKQALVRIFGFSLPALPDPVIFFAKRGWKPSQSRLANAVSLRGFVSRSAALSQKAALQMLLSVTTPPVKRRLERSAERDKREIINDLSADYAQSKRGAHFKSSHPLVFIISLLTTNRTLP